MNRIGQTLGGKFTLDELVGRSELGTVYKASTNSGTKVAVKVLHNDLEPTIARALLGNAKTISQLRNPRVARILGAKYSRAQDTFIVTEWLDPTNLADMIANSGALSPMRSANLLIQVCSALAALHAHNVPHANLKPTNVFLGAEDGVDVVTIVDAVGSGVLGCQANGEFIGITKHLAPEQLESLTASLAVDFFNLGVLAYFLVTGNYPFAAPTPSQTADRIRNGQYRSLLDAKPTLDKTYAEFVDRCIQPQSDTRFTELRKAAEFLSQVRPDEPVAETTNTQNDTGLAGLKDHEAPDPDATMAFLVSDELQAFFDEQDLDDAPPENTAEVPDEIPQLETETSDTDAVMPEAPFFTEEDLGLSENTQGPIDVSIDYASVELSLGPNHQMDDDLPFHSVSVSQSALDQEVSIIEESEGPPEISSHGLDLMNDDTSGASAEHQPNEPEQSTEASLETAEITEAHRSPMEALGPLDLDQKAAADAPVMAVSDFEVLATNEFERTASNENRFLSAKAQTGLKRPVFTLFLLSLLAIAAVLFQQQFEEEEVAEHTRLQVLRQQRIKQMEAAQRLKALAPKPAASKPVKVAPTPESKTPESPRQAEKTKVKPASKAVKVAPQPAKRKASSVSKEAQSIKGRKSRTRVKPSSKKSPQKKRRPKKSPKVDIVDPFANP